METTKVCVEWETDGHSPDLPDTVEVPNSVIGDYKGVPDDGMHITDYLSDTYACLVKSFSI